MVQAPPVRLESLYEQDETAWLEEMSALAAARRIEEMDYHNLSEYLSAMANSERREARNRLKVLLTHLLKWNFQPDLRTGSWQSTIDNQRDELTQWLESGTLRRHAEAVFVEVYAKSRRNAALETGLKIATYPTACPWSLDEILEEQV